MCGVSSTSLFPAAINWIKWMDDVTVVSYCNAAWMLSPACQWLTVNVILTWNKLTKRHVFPVGATSVPAFVLCATMWWRDCSCGAKAAATVDIWSTLWTGLRAALTAPLAVVTCASTHERATATVHTAGSPWERDTDLDHTQTCAAEKRDISFFLRGLECSVERRTALKRDQTKVLRRKAYFSGQTCELVFTYDLVSEPLVNLRIQKW